MRAADALKMSIDLSDMVLARYLGDLSDADLLERPGPGCNHLAWQLGHLISSEQQLLQMVCPNAPSVLPDGFAARHAKETAGSDRAADFLNRDEYLALYTRQRAATKAALDALSDADLDKPGPPQMAICPTVGAMFNLIAAHPLMHAGQFVPVRRRLGKPVVI